ncbi:MAG: hypothetical protein GX758_01735 [Tenericutes bacterium]|nr:hypothetical protein [Mycoplasmatota bacterium]
MTKVTEKTVKCANCNKESKQLFVFSVNFNLGNKDDNKSLMEHKQVCPHCKYTAYDISVKK